MKKMNLDITLSDQQIVRELQRTAEKHNQSRKMKNFVSSIVILAASLILITSIAFPVYYVLDHTMEPILSKDQIVLTSRIWKYSAGDIAAIKDGNQVYFGYIAAVPGDLIEVDENGMLRINNIYVDKSIQSQAIISYPYRLPEDSYLIQSDNEHFPTLTCMAGENIAAKALFTIWPLHEAGYVG